CVEVLPVAAPGGVVSVGKPFGPIGWVPLSAPVVVVAGKPLGLIGCVPLSAPVIVVAGKPLGLIGCPPASVVEVGNPFGAMTVVPEPVAGSGLTRVGLSTIPPAE